MYEFARGPLVWVALAGFIAGSLYQLITMLRLAKGEKNILPYMSARYGARSVLRWVVPFSTHNMRIRPLFTVVSFSFHLCLLVTPLFVMGHAVLWQQSWGVSWWSLPSSVADLMTVVVIFGGIFFLLRRATAPEVRNVTTWKDYALLLLVISPFVTGFVAHQQWLPYEATLLLHIVCGALWLIAIPFTRLAHMLYFVFTRSFMGSEFGAVRNARDW